MKSYDVIVVGGGNAALCAALSARRLVPRVLIIERAPFHMRGGNTRHTRNIRCAQAPNIYSSEEYGDSEFLEDLVGVTGGPENLELAKYTIQESRKLPAWMEAHGVTWQPPLAGTLHLGRTNRWFLGGGKALVNCYFQTAERMGIEIRYDTCVEDLVLEDGNCSGVAVTTGREGQVLPCKAVVIAAGGFEANLEWLKRYWGDAADNFCVRGTPYNDGKLLALLLQKNAKPVGDPKGFHAVAIDARSPKFDGGIVTRLDCIPFGIVLNRQGKRFYDEGENIWPKRYAIWGRLIAEQPGQTAFCIVDRKTINSFLPPIYKPIQADSFAGLAAQLDVDSQEFLATIQSYNDSTLGNANFQPSKLDGVKTRGLELPKSNWALPIDRPPFYALPLRPGITFTYMGVTVDGTSKVIDRDGHPFSNVYAAGEIMAGNILTKGYLAGFGLTIGSVFGRLAGQEAARHGNG
jgi:tricarballylate dehydrogenase